MEKFTPAQIACLKAVPFEVTYWGGKPMEGYPKKHGNYTSSTLESLIRKGFLARKRTKSGSTVYLSTADGKKAIAHASISA